MFLTLATAVAMPEFVGNDLDVARSKLAWEAAVACTGREGKTTPRVNVERGIPPIEWAAAVAIHDDKGVVSRIILREGVPPAILAHEIGHAWFSLGDDVVEEGRAEALAACVADRLGGEWGAKEKEWRLDEALPDLSTWDSKHVTGSVSETDVRRYAGYFAARRLFRIARGVVPDEQLWSDKLVKWADFVALIDAAGPAALPFSLALHAPPVELANALRDVDLDGLTALEEDILGTNSRRWDGNRDGWWDGAKVPERAGVIPMPRDGTPACLPWIPAGVAQIPIDCGGFLGSVVSPRIANETVNPQQGIVFPAEYTRVGGGMWLAPLATDLVMNPQSGYNAEATVLVNGSASAPTAELAAAMEAAAKQLPDSNHRIWAVVYAGERYLRTEHSKDVVRVVLPETMGRATVDEIAALAAAFNLVAYRRKEAGPSLALAVAHDELGIDLSQPVEALPGESRRWLKVKADCPTGWEGVLDGKCNP